MTKEENLYEKNNNKFYKIVDVSAKIGMFTGGAIAIIGTICKSEELYVIGANICAVSLGYTAGRNISNTQFERSKLEKKIKE